MQKIKFHVGSTSPFFSALNKEVEELVVANDYLRKAKRLLWSKMFFYFSLHICAYVFLYSFPHVNQLSFILNYIFIGISGMLLAYNVSHDACHETFSKNKNINYWLYHLSFNAQGTNAYLWKVRHTASHHLFPNVDGCDADIDNNPMIRLSPQHPVRWHQQFQHIYAVFIYAIYTLHWFLFKDFLYLTKQRLANLENKKHPAREWVLFFMWKLLYVFLLLVLPVMFGYPFEKILVAFLIMHVADSLFFIHSLIATHLCMETQFPKPDMNGYLPQDYHAHQLVTSLDYYPTSKFFNFIFGGFNSHAAHHLYPKLPHTIYPYITPVIQQKAIEFNVQYNELTLIDAIKSHYRYLKVMGRQTSATNNSTPKNETGKNLVF